MSNVQKAVELLYPTSELDTRNVKFFRGTGAEVTAEELAEELVSAANQISAGTAERVTNVDGF